MNPLLALDRRLVIAHRGASAYAPENTLAAFSVAAEQGADAFELDVHASRDGVAVVHHDLALLRTMGVAANVADRSRSELERLGVPPLEEVLRAFPRMPVIIEIKDPRAQGPVRQVLDALGAGDRCVVASERADALTEFRGGAFTLGASRRDIAWLWARAGIGWPPGRVAYRVLAVPERYRGLRVVSPRFVAAARRLGCPVHVWTVDDPIDARRLWGMGVCGILTNDPKRMLAARSS